MRMQPDHVYVIPPNQNLEITDGHLVLSDFEAPRGQRAPIDVLFRTLAQSHPDGVGILLSGSGSDGTLGMQAIKEHGGVLMVQSPEEADYDAMPRSAIATGLVDFVLPLAALAAKLLELHPHDLLNDLLQQPETLPARESEVLQQILRHLETQTGHDFSGYKHATVLRRLARRMRVVQAENLSAYLGYLHGQAHEAQALMKDLLISVTRFFRDPEALEALREQVIPSLFEGKGPGDEVRVWVPGCATGEEAYSIAMLLLEQAGTLAAAPTLQLFASDLDEEALTCGREGLYPISIAVDVAEARLQRFFVREPEAYRVKRELRDVIIFTPHSLLKDPPFSRLDLISCRNLLIYLQRDLQEQVLKLFHYVLEPEGRLFLGSAESVESTAHLFRATDATHRLYRRQSVEGLARLPDLPLSITTPRWRRPSRPRPATSQQAASDAERHRQMLEAHAPPSLMVDAEANVVHVSERATRYLQYPSGSPSPNLYRAILPELRLELRSALYQALERAEATIGTPTSVEIRGTRRLVQLYVTPEGKQTPPMALVVFAEANLPASGEQAGQEAGASEVDARLHQMETELEATQTHLHDSLEAAEAQQEALKAANEELQSINEEYKSTLEELETSKEELQSINEELTTVNHELQERLQDLSQANNTIHNLIATSDVGLLFVDRQLRIALYTQPLAQLFHLVPSDRGRPLAHVRHRLREVDIEQAIEQTLETLEATEREVQRDDGRIYLMRLTPYRTTDNDPEGVVVTLVDITARKQAEASLHALNTSLEQRVGDLQLAHEDLRQEVVERQRLQDQLFQQEKLAALGTLLANVAHELNNPLAVAALELDNLQEASGADSRSEDLETLGQAIERCQSVVQSFLALVRQQPPTRHAVALNAVIGDVLVLLEHILEVDDVRVERHLADDLPPLWADANQLHHVVANLLTNAYQALCETEAPRQLRLTTRLDGERRQVILEVADSGSGIPEALQHRVFEPFFTTKLQEMGSGLGLPLCRNIVEGHGGTIELSSEPGRGTTVWVTLPVAASEVESPEASL